MRNIIKGEIRKISMDLMQVDYIHSLVIDEVYYKIFNMQGEEQGLIEEGEAEFHENRVSCIIDTTQEDYIAGRTYFVRFFVHIRNTDKIIGGTVKVNILR